MFLVALPQQCPTPQSKIVHDFWPEKGSQSLIILCIRQVWLQQISGLAEQQNNTVTTQQEHTAKPHTKQLGTNHPSMKSEANSVHCIPATAATLPSHT
jgi:hypothetical protein